MKSLIKVVCVLLFPLIIGSLFLHPCTGEKKDTSQSLLEMALQQAGENWAELEKALSRYQNTPADSLKYKAACFLIENMPYYTYYKGKQLDQYLTYYSLLQKTRGLGISPQVVADSIKHLYGPLQMDSLQSYKDIATVDSAYLCSNIEWAFKVWQEQPWGKHVSFADFCEYVLPYRIGDETLVAWRESIYQKYNPLLDSLRASEVLDKENPIVAARCLLDSIRKGGAVFTTAVPDNLLHVGPEVAQQKAGSCRELTDFVVYVCRALGIPCSIDFMPIRGDENDSHQWVAFTDKYGILNFHHLQFDFTLDTQCLFEESIIQMVDSTDWKIVRIGPKAEHLFQKIPLWGHLFIGTPDEKAIYNKVVNGYFSFNCEKEYIQSTSGVFLLGYDEQYALQYFGDNLRPY